MYTLDAAKIENSIYGQKSSETQEVKKAFPEALGGE